MKSSLRKPAWIAIAMLAVFSTVAAVQACTAFSDLHTIKIGTDSNGVLGDLHVQNILPQKESCSREAMDQCEYACLMPGGVLDLYCYEDCIDIPSADRRRPGFP